MHHSENLIIIIIIIIIKHITTINKNLYPWLILHPLRARVKEEKKNDESWAKQKTYYQAQTHLLKLHDVAVIEFEAQTAIVQLMSKHSQ